MSKTILCYGDSNTWGADPAGGPRYLWGVRWPGVLQNRLGDRFRIVEEGLNGRTTVWDDPLEGYKNGQEYLIPCLHSHAPIDLVVIMLGTNDLKRRFGLPASDIAKGAGVLGEIVLKSAAGPRGAAPKLLLLAPPPLAKLTDLAEMFADAAEKSQMFGHHYEQVATELGCAFLNTAAIVTSSNLDGIHLDALEHTKLGESVAQKVLQLLE